MLAENLSDQANPFCCKSLGIPYCTGETLFWTRILIMSEEGKKESISSDGGVNGSRNNVVVKIGMVGDAQVTIRSENAMLTN